MKRVRFVWKVFGGTVVVILVASLILTLSVVSTIRERMTEQIEERVCEQASLVRVLVAGPGEGLLDERTLRAAAEGLGGSRVTVIAEGGKVLFDTHEDPALMEDHSRRPEILAPGTAVARTSRTLGVEMTYCALPIRDEEGRERGWVRVALSTAGVETRIGEIQGAVRSGILLATAIGLVLAYVFARRVTRPVREIGRLVDEFGRGGTSRRLRVPGGDEFHDLAAAVNSMIDELEERLGRIRRDRSQRDAVLSALTEGVVAVDRAERVLFVNAAARRLLQTGGGDVLGVPVRELTRIPEVGQTISRCLEEGSTLRTEARIRRPDGDLVLELGAAPFDYEEGSTQGCVLALHDISEQRRLEAVRRDFVANVSHELKTPLTSMRGFLETVLEDEAMEPEERRRFLERAHHNTERLAAIVTDLLSLARLESSAGALSFEPTDLGRIAGNVAREFQGNARGVEVRLAAADGPLPVSADAQALRTAVANLIDNAVKYSPPGGAVDVRLSDGGGRVRVEVQDRGPGIPAAEQERIFERFYRVDKDRSRLLGGTGLGLSIVRHVVLAHGGTVTVDSAPGRGSTFRIELPRLAGTEDGEAS